MSEDILEDVEQEPVKESPGLRLRRAREAADVTVEDIARQMKLSRDVIDAIESDNSNIPVPSTFILGYVRTIKKIVRLEDDTIVADYEDLLKDAGKGLFSKGSQNLKSFRESDAEPVKGASKKILFLLLVVIAGAGWFFSKNPKLLENQDILKVIKEKVPESGTLLDGQKQEGKSKSKETTSTEEITEVPSAAAPVYPTLTFYFSGSSQLSVTDADGTLLVEGDKTVGNVIEVKGKPPYLVVLGNPRVVRISRDNERVDISHLPFGQKATFSIE